MKIINNQKGFISIPIIIGVILFISIGIVATVGVVKYKAKIKSGVANIFFATQNEEEKIEKQLPEEREIESNLLPLTEATSTDGEIEALKQEIETLKKQQPEIIYKETRKEVPIQLQQPIPQSIPIPTTPKTVPVMESDYSNICVELYLNTIDVINAMIGDIDKMKSSYKGMKQIWQDEITRNQIYLKTYPNDPLIQPEINIYQATIDYLGEELYMLDKGKRVSEDVIRGLQSDINVCKNNKVSKKDLDKIFDVLHSLSDQLIKMETAIKERYNGVIEQNRKVAITIDTVRGVALAQIQQHQSDIDNTISETDRVIQQSQATIQQAQNIINSMSASRLIYCTATRVTTGIVDVICR